jgi:hypothetical protein
LLLEICCLRRHRNRAPERELSADQSGLKGAKCNPLTSCFFVSSPPHLFHVTFLSTFSIESCLSPEKRMRVQLIYLQETPHPKKLTPWTESACRKCGKWPGVCGQKDVAHADASVREDLGIEEHRPSAKMEAASGRGLDTGRSLHCSNRCAILHFRHLGLCKCELRLWDTAVYPQRPHHTACHRLASASRGGRERVRGNDLAGSQLHSLGSRSRHFRLRPFPSNMTSRNMFRGQALAISIVPPPSSSP